MDENNYYYPSQRLEKSQFWSGFWFGLFVGMITGLILGIYIFPAGSNARKTFIKGWMCGSIIRLIIIAVSIVFILYEYSKIIEYYQELQEILEQITY